MRWWANQDCRRAGRSAHPQTLSSSSPTTPATLGPPRRQLYPLHTGPRPPSPPRRAPSSWRPRPFRPAPPFAACRAGLSKWRARRRRLGGPPGARPAAATPPPHARLLTLGYIGLVVLPLLVHRDGGWVVFYPRVARLAVLHLGLVVELVKRRAGRRGSVGAGKREAPLQPAPSFPSQRSDATCRATPAKTGAAPRRPAPASAPPPRPSPLPHTRCSWWRWRAAPTSAPRGVRAAADGRLSRRRVERDHRRRSLSTHRAPRSAGPPSPAATQPVSVPAWRARAPNGRHGGARPGARLAAPAALARRRPPRARVGRGRASCCAVAQPAVRAGEGGEPREDSSADAPLWQRGRPRQAPIPRGSMRRDGSVSAAR